MAKISIDEAVKSLEKRFEKGIVVNFEEGRKDVEVFSSGSIALNEALGGGYPIGRIIEIYGAESSGKTTLAIHACAEIQNLGKSCLYIDVENAFDPFYAEHLGVNFKKEKWQFSQPSSGEEAFEILDVFLDVKDIGLIVVDSVAALTPKSEIDGDYGESKMGLHARLMSQAMRKLVGKIQKSSCTVIFINQTRDKIGIVYGSPVTTTGGNALKFYASQRLEVARAGQNKEGEEVVSNRTRVKVVKNKIAPPFRKCEFDIVFGKGIDKFQELIDIAVERDIITKKGSWYSYGDTKLGQGNNSVVEILNDNPELLQEIKSKIS